MVKLSWRDYAPPDRNGFISHRKHLSCESTTMCLAIPAKILGINDSLAQVDFGRGVTREVNIMLVEAKVGDYVLVHAGYAIEVLEEEDALETLRLWDEVLAAEAE